MTSTFMPLPLDADLADAILSCSDDLERRVRSQPCEVPARSAVRDCGRLPTSSWMASLSVTRSGAFFAPINQPTRKRRTRK